MSKSYKLSLLKLQVPSNLKGISRREGLAQIPASPFLVTHCDDIPENAKQAYLQLRESHLKYKLDETIRDNRLRPYQNQDVNFLMRLTNKAVFNQQRTGKTPTTIVTLKSLNQNCNLIVAPGATLYSWLKEFKQWHGGNAIVVLGTYPKKRREKLYNTFKGTIIISYKVATKDLEHLLNLKFDAMVVDEAHRLRNFFGEQSSKGSQQSKAIMKLGKNVPARYALTGTPTPNYAWNIFGILHFLFPTLFTSYWQFVDYYFTVDDVIINRELDTKKDIIGFKSKEKEIELLQFIETISVQRKRSEVMKWIPKVDYEEILLPMSKEQIEISTALTNYFEYNDIVCVNPLDVMIKQRMLSLSPLLVGGCEESPKIKYFKEFIDEYPETPFIITSFFTSFLQILHKELPNSRLLIGGMNDKEKEAVRKDFQEGKFNILLGNIDVIKEGLNLSRAEVLFFTDQSFVYEDNNQVADRFIPTTLEEAVKKEQQKIVKLIHEDSIDIYIDENLKLKKSSSEIINNYVRRLNNGLDRTTR